MIADEPEPLKAKSGKRVANSQDDNFEKRKAYVLEERDNLLKQTTNKS